MSSKLVEYLVDIHKRNNEKNFTTTTTTTIVKIAFLI